MLSGNSLRQTVHTHRATVHQSAKLVAALLRVAGVNAGLAVSNGSLPPGLSLTSGTRRSVIKYGLPLPLQTHLLTYLLTYLLIGVNAAGVTGVVTSSI